MFCNKCGVRVEANSSFCNKCGNCLIEKSNTNIPQTNINQSNKNNNNLKKFFIIVGAIIIFVSVTIVLSSRSNNYYFNDDGYDDVANNVGGNQSNIKKESGKTIIITDNIYEGVSISSVNDANALISKDSTDQKSKCPKGIKKIEDEIISKYGITAVNLCEMDTGLAKEVKNVIGTVYNEFPEARGHLTNLSLKNTTSISEYSVIAAFMPIFSFATTDSITTYPWVIKTQVLLNSPFFLNKNRLTESVKDSSESGHFPPNATVYSPVAHELGHYLSFLAMMNNYEMDSLLLIDTDNVDKLNKIYDDFSKGDFSYSMINEAYNNYKEDTSTIIEFDEWRGTISKYALAKDNSGNYIYDETIAEAFHDVYLNKNSAKDASKYIMAVLKKKLGR